MRKAAIVLILAGSMLGIVAGAAGAQAFQDRNCPSFSYQEDAQEFFRQAGPGDPHRLDANGDGVACEELPHRPAGAPASPAPSGTPVAAPTASAPITVRSSVDLDCRDFEFQEDAQAFFKATVGDPYRLDEDNDGIACEALPQVTPRPTSKPTSAPPSNAVQRNTDLDCRDFATQADAQAFFDSTVGDPHGLDTDRDGKACEAPEVAAPTASGAVERSSDTTASVTKARSGELPRTGGSDMWRWLVGMAGVAFVIGGQLVRLGADSGVGFWRRQALR